MRLPIALILLATAVIPVGVYVVIKPGSADHPAAPVPPLSPGAPGTLIAQSRVDGAPHGASAWHIYYRSIDENGASVEISGLVVVPNGPAPKEGRDIVSWGHSTVGIAEACAPSTNAKRFENIAGLPQLLANNYIVTATDLQGLGTPGPHPYLVGISSARAMLDAVRAARALSSVGASKRYALWGESQGAHAALWAAQLAPTYMPHLDLVGVAAAAPPTDLIANFDKITQPLVRSLMTGYTSDSWSQIYNIPLSTFANWIGRFFIHRLARDCLRLDAVSAAANTTLLLASHQLPNHLGDPWIKPLRRNSVAPVHLTVPLFIAQGGADNVVNPGLTRAFAAANCRAGNVVEFHPDQNATHITIAARSALSVVAWISDRFAHKPAASDCAALVQTGEHNGKSATLTSAADMPGGDRR